MILSKSEVSEILGIDEDNIPDKLIDWAELQVEALTSLKISETSKTFEKLIFDDTTVINLPEGNIKSIDKVYFDDEEQSFTEGTEYKINKNSGLVYFTGGITGGTYLKIEYTISSTTTSNTLLEFLFVLLVLKGIGIFTPELMGALDYVRIGRFAKKYGTYSDIQENLDNCINELVDQIKGNKGFGYNALK